MTGNGTLALGNHLERYYREDKANRITNDIQQVTGQAPRRFAQYVRDYAPLLQSAAAAA